MLEVIASDFARLETDTKATEAENQRSFDEFATKSAQNRARVMSDELEWIRMSQKARQSKGKARLSAYDRLVVEAAEVETRARELQIDIPANQRLGDQVIEVDRLSKGFDDRLLIDDLSFSLPPAGIAGTSIGETSSVSRRQSTATSASTHSSSSTDLSRYAASRSLRCSMARWASPLHAWIGGVS